MFQPYIYHHQKLVSVSAIRSAVPVSSDTRICSHCTVVERTVTFTIVSAICGVNVYRLHFTDHKVPNERVENPKYTTSKIRGSHHISYNLSLNTNCLVK